MGLKPRIYLLPLSLPMAIISSIRNWAFNRGILKSKRFDIPVLSVGNLSTGGTGKTPMVSFFIEKSKGEIAVLSRGYGRNTKGFIEVSDQHNATSVGDEPMEQKRKHPNTIVAVCEERVAGVTQLLKNHSNLSGVILDDAFQHRYITPSRSILLTPYDQIYARDHILPAGNLRESKRGAKRADVIVVTKCPNQLTLERKEEVKRELNTTKPVFFSKITYAPNPEIHNKKWILVTGIATPSPIYDYLKSINVDFIPLKFPDHYPYSEKDVSKMKEAIAQYSTEGILTTSKDFERLSKFNATHELTVSVLKISLDFFGDENSFLKAVNIPFLDVK